MNRSNFVKQFRERFIAELQLKTSWGRNELIAKLDEILIDVLSDEVTTQETPTQNKLPRTADR